MTNFTKLPLSLIGVARWLLYILRADTPGGKPRKVPIDPNRLAPGNRPDNCSSFEFVVDTLNNADPVIMAEPPFSLPPFAGVGFRFDWDETAPFVFVDLDACVNPTTGEIVDWARTFIEHLNSYTEISASGTGIHILVLSSQPPQGGCRKGRIEIYSKGRWAAMTGNHVAGTPDDLVDRTEELLAFHRVVFGEPTKSQTPPKSGLPNVVALSDDVIINRARTARNGARFRQLFDEPPIRENHSEEDFELCRMLAFWTGGDAERMDRLFRRSALMRDKWHRTDYRERTIAHAIETCGDTYGANRQTPNPPAEGGL